MVQAAERWWRLERLAMLSAGVPEDMLPVHAGATNDPIRELYNASGSPAFLAPADTRSSAPSWDEDEDYGEDEDEADGVERKQVSMWKKAWRDDRTGSLREEA